MSEPTYTITITEAERTAWAKLLGAFVTKLLNAPAQIESAATSDPRPTTAQPSGHVLPSPIEPRDRWARDRKGTESPNPAGGESISVHLAKAERKDLTDGRVRMRVAWQNADRGYSDASCWDDKLFPFLAAATKSPDTTTIYIVKNGKYTNIVGIRA